MKRWLLFTAMMWLACGVRAQVLDAKTYGTTGKPSAALATPDGKYVLVTVNRNGGESGLDVFAVEGDKLKRVAFQPLGNAGAQDVILIPHSKVIAVGVSNAGVAFLSLDEVLTGKAKAGVLPQGAESGTGYLAVSPDGKFLFAANEYGNRGNIGVIALDRKDNGEVSPRAVAQIPTPNTTPGVAISPDGLRVYAEGEVVPPAIAAELPGHGVAELERSGCTQALGRPAMPNGVLYVIDAAKATAGDRAIVSRVDAGCSPVREAITSDGSKIYVTARGDNRVLVFDAAKLEHDPQHALLRAIPSGGDAPVGVKLFDNDTKLLVANSNRFKGGAGNATVFDLSGAEPKLMQTIKTGEFPRNISSSPDGRTLYLTIFNGNELMVLRQK